MQLEPEQFFHIATTVGSALAAGGGAWAVLKMSVNGMRGDVREIKGDVKKLVESDSKQNERIGVAEATLRSHEGWIRRVEQVGDRRTKSGE